MKTIDEQLWDYIDGNCTSDEKCEIESKIASDSQYKLIYKELIAVNKELAKIDFEEPSMFFTRNVMEKIDLEPNPVALKTKVDNRVIYAIASFFVLSIFAIFSYVIANSDFSLRLDLPKINLSLFNDASINSNAIKIFIMIDVALALLYFDSLLRKKNLLEPKKEV